MLLASRQTRKMCGSQTGWLVEQKEGLLPIWICSEFPLKPTKFTRSVGLLVQSSMKIVEDVVAHGNHSCHHLLSLRNNLVYREQETICSSVSEFYRIRVQHIGSSISPANSN